MQQNNQNVMSIVELQFWPGSEGGWNNITLRFLAQSSEATSKGDLDGEMFPLKNSDWQKC